MLHHLPAMRQDHLVFLPFRLDPESEQLWRDDQLVPVPPKQFAVLRYLVERAGRLVTKEELLQGVWPDTRVSDGILKVYIRELRDILGDDSRHPRFIETVPRRGHRFIARVISNQPSVVSSKEGLEARGLGLVAPLPPRTQVPSLQPPASNLVGREAELLRLHKLFEKALYGERQLVFVTGEAGIGKTTLVEAFLRARGNEEFGGGPAPPQPQAPHAASPAPRLRVAHGQCIEHYGEGEPYLPLLEALSNFGRSPEGGQLVAVLRQYAPTWLVQMPAFVKVEELAALQRQIAGTTRERMLREMVEAIEALTSQHPLVLWLEDLHWADYSTVDWLTTIAQGRGPARLLVIGTYRPVDAETGNHPLIKVKQELQARGRCEDMRLGFLTSQEVGQYLTTRCPDHQFPPNLAAVIHRNSEGNPLFVVNLVAYLIAREVIVKEGEHWQLRTAIEEVGQSVPNGLQQLIEKRIERLTEPQRRLLEVASVGGLTFSAVAVAAGLEATVEQVDDWCEELVKHGQFLQAQEPLRLPGGVMCGNYQFLHALYQTVLYERIPPMRRVRLHHHVSDLLEKSYGDHAKDIAAELTLHFEQGRDIQRAVHYRGYAAQTALQRGAPREAMGHLHKALVLLETLPDTPERTRRELSLQVTLGAAAIAAKGLGAEEVERAFSRARVLSQQVEDSPLNIPILIGLGIFYLSRAEFQTGIALAEHSLRLAESAHDTASMLTAYLYLAANYHEAGDLRTARVHYEQTLRLYDPQHHSHLALLTGQDPSASAGAMLAWTLWLLGYPEQSQSRIQQACTHAHNLGHANTVAICLMVQFVGYAVRGELPAALVSAEECMTFSLAQGVPAFAALGRVAKGWTLVRQGQQDEGIASLRRGLAEYAATGSRVNLSWWLLLLIDACCHAGQIEDGLTALTEALAFVDQTGERLCEAELWRLRGELTLAGARGVRLGACGEKDPVPSSQPLAATGAEREAEECFHKAMTIAQRQEAKSLELRAVMSLARLWQQQGKQQNAYNLLVDVYGWFTEGFETKDLQAAKTLLAELRAKTSSRRQRNRRS